MSGQWKEVVRLSFKGERFRDHALDLDALTELRQFQKMVAETAKALWRKANPDRKNLPPHFNDRTRLCLRRIDEGSAVAPLEVCIEDQEQYSLWLPEPVEVNDAIDLVCRVYGAVHADTPLPDEFPKELLPEYAQWGQGLSDDEALELAPPGKSVVRITAVERARLTALVESAYQDEVDVIGQVLEADVRKRKFQLWLDEETSIRVPFTEAQEAKVTTALKEHGSLRIRVLGRGELSPQGTLQQIVSVTDLLLVGDDDHEFDQNAPAIEDVIADIFKDVPDEAWGTLPTDLSERLDHYLYGGLAE